MCLARASSLSQEIQMCTKKLDRKEDVAISNSERMMC
jgi:hypothetical protein